MNSKLSARMPHPLDKHTKTRLDAPKQKQVDNMTFLRRSLPTFQQHAVVLLAGHISPYFPPGKTIFSPRLYHSLPPHAALNEINHHAIR